MERRSRAGSIVRPRPALTFHSFILGPARVGAQLNQGTQQGKVLPPSYEDSMQKLQKLREEIKNRASVFRSKVASDKEDEDDWSI